MGQKLNSGIGKQQQQQQQTLQPPPTLNSLVGSTSLFNYKFLMLDDSTQNKPASLNRLNVRAINLAPMSTTSPTSYSNRLSSLSTTVSTFSSSTDNFVDTTTSSTMRSRATSTPKMTTTSNDSNVNDRSRLHLFNRFSTASTMSSISSSTGSSPRQSQQPQQSDQIVVKKPPQLVKSTSTGKERADRRATSKRASFKEKLSRINKRWSVSRLNEATASSGVNSNNDKVKIIQ